MLGHRKLNLQDYLAIFRRRGWMIIVPAILVPIMALSVSLVIPPQFVSQTLVIIDQQKVPDDYVKPVVSSDLDSRLASMREQILSRSRIQPIIERYNLYADKGMSMDDRIDLARKSIGIKPIHSDIARANGLPGFFISFVANDAHTAQLVCGEITGLFLSENLRTREDSAQGTTDFLKSQLDDAKRNLDEQDAKLAAFQRQYAGRLPGEEQTNLSMVTTLNTQLEAATQALARMEQDKTYMESLLSQQIAAAPSTPASPTAAAPSAQQAELQSLLSQEADLTAHYTADYPDVIAIRRKIADLRRQMASTASASAGSGKSGAASRNDSPAVQQLRAQLRATEIGIEAKRKQQAQLQSQVGMYQERISSSPLIQEQFKEITRDYQTTQTAYNGILAKVQESKMAVDMERRQQGEQFRVMDPPNLPDAPTFPKRSVFGLGGLAGGLALGLALVAFLEFKDTALRSDRDVWAFTKLPTLAVIEWSDELAARPSRLRRLRGLFQRKKKEEALVQAPG